MAAEEDSGHQRDERAEKDDEPGSHRKEVREPL
jgi:hypothetical protein